MYKSFDFRCTACGRTFDDLIKAHEPNPPCPNCGAASEKLMGIAKPFTEIVPTSLTSKRFKAGYVHQFANRPAEKISVSVPAKLDK